MSVPRIATVDAGSQETTAVAEPSKPNRRDGADTVQPEVRRSRRIFDVAVLVLGMHRTGTSLTASVLEALGVDLSLIHI